MRATSDSQQLGVTPPAPSTFLVKGFVEQQYRNLGSVDQVGPLVESLDKTARPANLLHSCALIRMSPVVLRFEPFYQHKI